MRRRCIHCGRPGALLLCWRCIEKRRVEREHRQAAIAGWLRLAIPGTSGLSTSSTQATRRPMEP